MTMLRESPSEADLDRMRSGLDDLAAELARSRQRFVGTGRRPGGGDLDAALLTYRRLHDRITLVLGELTAAAQASSASW
jgi:hypothetical protein